MLYANSSNAQIAVESKGWWSCIGLGILLIGKICQQIFKENTPCDPPHNE